MKTPQEKILEKFDKEFKVEEFISGIKIRRCIIPTDGRKNKRESDVFIKRFITKAFSQYKKELLREQLFKWKRAKTEIDAIYCDCGKPWNDSDLVDYIDEAIDDIKKLLTKLIIN